jgi:hypothetical protein
MGCKQRHKCLGGLCPDHDCGVPETRRERSSGVLDVPAMCPDSRKCRLTTRHAQMRTRIIPPDGHISRADNSSSTTLYKAHSSIKYGRSTCMRHDSVMKDPGAMLTNVNMNQGVQGVPARCIQIAVCTKTELAAACAIHPELAHVACAQFAGVPAAAVVAPKGWSDHPDRQLLPCGVRAMSET